MDLVFRLQKLIAFYGQAHTRYRVHSPFAYRLIEETLDDNRHFYAFDELSHLHQQLKNNDQPITLLELGAGAASRKKKHTTIGRRYRTAGSSLFFYKFLFRLVRYTRPKTILELGTNFGMSALSMHRAAPHAKLITIEGCPQTAHFASQLFAQRKSSITLLQGPFEQQLPHALAQLGQIDFAFIDGNHRKEATIRYFRQLLPFTHSSTILLFDDIYWSKGMHEAWCSIIQHHSVRFSADFFFAGMLAFRTQQVVPLHLKLIMHRLKPWQMGFFN